MITMSDRRSQRRRAVLKGLGSLGAASLAGCIGTDDPSSGGGGTTTGGGGTGSGGEGATETGASGGWRNGPMADAINFWEMSGSWSGHIERYEKQTGASVKRTKMGYDEIINKLQTRLLSGSGAPDVALVEYSSLKQVSNTGGLRDLTPWIQDADIKGKFPSGMWQGISTDDKIYEVPYDINPTNLFYRKDVWEKHGLNEDVETWDQLIEEGKKLPGDVDLLSLPAAACDLYWRMLYRQLGGQAFDADGNIAFGNDTCLRVFRTLGRLGDAGITSKVANWSQQWFNGFGDGTITGYCSGAWFSATLRSTESLNDTAGQWRAMKLPAFEKGGNRASNRGGSGVCIPKAASDEKARRAFDFAMATCADAKEMALLYKNVGNFGGYKPAWEKSAFDEPLEFFGGQKLGRRWAEQARNIPSYRFTVDTPTVMDVINSELRNVVYGDADPKKALDRAVNQAEKQTDRDVA